MSQRSSLVRNGITVTQGTPLAPLIRPTLFLRMLRINSPTKAPRTIATLHVVRPGPRGYVIKELIPDMELEPQAALDKAVAIAERGEIAEIYLNADLANLPITGIAAAG
jgi:hypothetical protein